MDVLVEFSGNPNLVNANRWQPLTLSIFIDQSGNEIPFNIPSFLSSEWGVVTPFALKANDLTIHERNGHEYWVYHDPGMPPQINPQTGCRSTDEYRWSFELAALWSSHLAPGSGG